MVEGQSFYSKRIILKQNRLLANLHKRELILQMSLADTKGSFDILLNANRSIYRQRLCSALKGSASKQPWKSIYMVPMQMGNKNLLNFSRLYRCLQNLMLGCFSTIEHPAGSSLFIHLQNN